VADEASRKVHGRCGWGGWPRPHFYLGKLFSPRIIADQLKTTSDKNNFGLQNLGCAQVFCLGRVFAGLPQNLFGLLSFCTNHFAFRFIFAYAEMGEWLTGVTHGNF
jgi:hypothetical protein